MPLCECLDLAPSFRDPFVERKKSACETDAQIVIEPALKCASLRLIFVEQVNPFSNLSDGRVFASGRASVRRRQIDNALRTVRTHAPE